tara:strand:+ start:158 stop:349 length:192 start_codon:yes stop_codon:yes gene_type:complete
MSNFLERTAFERIELGTIVKTSNGLERVAGVSEDFNGKIELTTEHIDTRKESEFMLDEVEVID